jgi:hypothetical protein
MEAREQAVPWRKWGPYLAERQWGTVREDYSINGDAWCYFTHDQSRSRAYRWGEDGIAGISDHNQKLCFAPSFWNGTDAILKERLFGLTNTEGNHGEDVKEYYFYLDNTPTHSYMKYLYKYPQRAFPYDDLLKQNQRRSRDELEYELLDTGIFGEDRYFDIFVEYAKYGPEDLLISITAHNRGPESARLHILPTLWFRNTWFQTPQTKPSLKAARTGLAIVAQHLELGDYELICEERVPFLFVENETNRARIFGSYAEGYAKDGINDYVVNSLPTAVNPNGVGTKAAAHYRLEVPAEGQATIRLWLRSTNSEHSCDFAEFDDVLRVRRQEADEFYASIVPDCVSDDTANVMRQALAGMLWTKQFYYFDIDLWLDEHKLDVPGRSAGYRNSQWFHLLNMDIISMPDKWEYPWYAAWDLAFHTIPLALVDLDFAKNQLELMLRNSYLHPSGQLPAYEWNFGDVNPPVHAWATLAIHNIEKLERGTADYAFLKHAFHKLLLNFTWWVNRKDPRGNNVFEGGFLGLDNIGIFDRSSPLPTGGYLEQADGTAWVALFCQNMLEIALELAKQDEIYAEMALKFLEHFLWIASAMDRIGEHEDEMWDEEDGFFYDVLRLPGGEGRRLKVRSMIGLLPLCATTVLERKVARQYPEIAARARRFIERHSDLQVNIAPVDKPGYADRTLFAVLNEEKLRRVLSRMLDESEFLSPYGIRSLSRYYEADPYSLDLGGVMYRVQYLPAESNTAMFGGNSNWRGPVWFPLNLLILRAIHQFYLYYGDDFKVECPTGSGKLMTLFEVAQEILRRLINIFLRDQDGMRPVYGGSEKFQRDPHWRDLILFYEYFHGDNGAGIGASHQTGWTGAVARLIQFGAYLNPEIALRYSTSAEALEQSRIAA